MENVPVEFANVKINDVLVFTTRDNGFTGSGGSIERMGTVISITNKSVTVRTDRRLHTPTWLPNRKRPEPAFPTARLRRSSWYDRSVRRVIK
jgi:hypothetical protein